MSKLPVTCWIEGLRGQGMMPRMAAANASARSQRQPIPASPLRELTGFVLIVAEIQFRCLAQSDPEVHRPMMKPVPSAVIRVQK